MSDLIKMIGERRSVRSYYPAPVYYPPTIVQVPAAPAAQQAPAPDYSWYYCPSAKGYYPYVRDCPGGWQRVSPTPPQ